MAALPFHQQLQTKKRKHMWTTSRIHAVSAYECVCMCVHDTNIIDWIGVEKWSMMLCGVNECLLHNVINVIYPNRPSIRTCHACHANSEISRPTANIQTLQWHKHAAINNAIILIEWAMTGTLAWESNLPDVLAGYQPVPGKLRAYAAAIQGCCCCY